MYDQWSDQIMSIITSDTDPDQKSKWSNRSLKLNWILDIYLLIYAYGLLNSWNINFWRQNSKKNSQKVSKNIYSPGYKSMTLEYQALYK